MTEIRLKPGVHPNKTTFSGPDARATEDGKLEVFLVVPTVKPANISTFVLIPRTNESAFNTPKVSTV